MTVSASQALVWEFCEPKGWRFEFYPRRSWLSRIASLRFGTPALHAERSDSSHYLRD
jgi:hypothetical protein